MRPPFMMARRRAAITLTTSPTHPSTQSRFVVDRHSTEVSEIPVLKVHLAEWGSGSCFPPVLPCLEAEEGALGGVGASLAEAVTGRGGGGGRRGTGLQRGGGKEGGGRGPEDRHLKQVHVHTLQGGIGWVGGGRKGSDAPARVSYQWRKHMRWKGR